MPQDTHGPISTLPYLVCAADSVSHDSCKCPFVICSVYSSLYCIEILSLLLRLYLLFVSQEHCSASTCQPCTSSPALLLIPTTTNTLAIARC